MTGTGRVIGNVFVQKLVIYKSVLGFPTLKKIGRVSYTKRVSYYIKKAIG